MNRTCDIEPLGDVDEEAGEFWVNNPFMMPSEGHNLSAYERNRMFLNSGATGFIDVSRYSACDIDSDSRSVVAADFDRDGRTDLLVGSVGGGPLRLFLNRLDSAATANAVQLVLVGSKGNRPAIGATVRARCGDAVITRDVFPANGFMGQAPPELLLGVGSATQIDELQVRWPSGTTQVLRDLPVRGRITVTEDSPTPEIILPR
jgi:hypothetical protein